MSDKPLYEADDTMNGQDEAADAFAAIAEEAASGLAECDERLAWIRRLLAVPDAADDADEADAPARAKNAQNAPACANANAPSDEAASPADVESPPDVRPEQIRPAEPNLRAERRDAFVRARLREARRAAANASWQLLLGFGLSFAVRVGLLGFWLGGWLDRRWLGGRGYGAAAMIVLVIFYSFYMLYADLRRQDLRWQREKARLQAEAEAEFDRDNA